MSTVYSIPANMFFAPDSFDYSVGGVIPVWVFIILGLAFIGFIGLLFMLYFYWIMKPVAGYGKVGDAATAKGSPTQVYSIWKNRSFVIESMWYYGNVLAYGNPLKQPQMWFHNSEKATGVSAGKPVMITRDGFDGTVDFIAEMAFCEIPAKFNKEWGMEIVPKLDINGNPVFDAEGKPVTLQKERKDENGKPYTLTCYDDIFNRLNLLERLYPDGIDIPIYQLYDLSKVYKFTPQDVDSLKFGGDKIAEAQEYAANEDMSKPGFMDRFGLLIICGVIGLASLGMVWYAFPIK